MNKAIFLDRDGVLNRELGHYVTTLSDFEVLPTMPLALQVAAKAGFLLIVVSNQGGVAKGLYTLNEVWAMHDAMQQLLRPLGVQLTEGYYCPHHPEIGLCLCRKPKALLLEKAIARFNIDPAKSYMVGDRQRDMDAATTAGVQGIMLPSNGDLLQVVKQLV